VLPKKPAYQRFIARQQLRKYAIVLEPLLGSRLRATMEVQLEAVFSMWSAPRLYHSIDSACRTVPQNLRPISLLSTTGKLFEKVILKIL
jgi:hypothetical protein